MTDDRPTDPRDPPEPPVPPGGQEERPSMLGPLAWFAKNSVAANVIMLILLIGGFFGLRSVTKEVFPEIELDMVLVQVPYPGASPEEVEQGVLLAVEEEVRTLDDIKEVRSTALEGIGVTTVVLETGADADQALNDIKARVDRITSFPQDAERPFVFLGDTRTQVISLVFYGDQSEAALRALAEQAREELLADERISYAELAAVRPYEISIEVPQEELRRYNLTLGQVAAAIRQASIELPGGGVKTAGGEILVRTTERRQRGAEFESIVLISRPDGTAVTVGDVATVRDDFTDNDQRATFYGDTAAMVQVFRTGDETPLDIAAAVKEYAATASDELPEGVQIAPWFDFSEFYAQRVDLLTKNALIGLVLVLIVLGIFLEVKLAFWVMLGIPISFLGTFAFLPATDVSVNMISLFAFILVLGMVVDDAIVVGEAIYLRRQRGDSRLDAAVAGVREVAAPITFAILTTIIAFMPMLFVPGVMGKFFRVIPIVVILVLLLSLVESLMILPAHLAESKEGRRGGVLGWIHAQQQRFSAGVDRFVAHRYVPLLRAAVRRRYLTMALALCTLFVSCGAFVGGHVKQSFMPQVDGDVVVAGATLPFGTAVERSNALEARLVAAASEVLEEAGGAEALSRGLFAQVGAHSMMAGPGGTPAQSGSHLVEVAVYLVGPDQRPITSSEFARRWREKVGDVAGLESLSFSFSSGPSAGKPVNVELSHPSHELLERAATWLALELRGFAGLYDIDDGYAAGKEQLDFELTPEARSLGVTEQDLASQVRSAFFGTEVVRQQRGRDEVRAYVRLPRAERASEYDIEQFLIRTPEGGEIPLFRAARIERGRSYTDIQRLDGRRVLTVTAEVDPAIANATEVNRKLVAEVIPRLEAEFPSVSWSMGGEQKEQAEAFGSLFMGAALALCGIFSLLAIAFRSYSQPVLIMLAIPFGFVGALAGHLALGFEWSLMSMLGLVALAGVAVNDSLVLISAVNRFREDGMSIEEAVISGGARRFRPILLTSLTTFFGLTPMLLETEVQAQFLVPMAVSLGFGIIFATIVTLLVVPTSYMILEDARRGASRSWAKLKGAPPPGPPVDAGAPRSAGQG